MMMMLSRNTRDKLRCFLPLKSLVALYHSREADPNEYARKVYDKMLQSRPLPPLERFNSLLGRFLEFDLYPAAISLNREMVLHGIARDEYTLSTLVSSYCHLKHLGFGLSVMGNFIKMGLQADAIALDSLIHGFLLKKKVPEAAEIFSKLLRDGHCMPSFVALRTLLKGFEDIDNPIIFQCVDALLADLQARGIEHDIGQWPDKDSFAIHVFHQNQHNMTEFVRAWANRDVSYANQVPRLL